MLIKVIYETCVNSANQAEGEEDIRNDTLTTFYSMSQLQIETTMDYLVDRVMSKEVFVKAVLIDILGCACTDFSSFVAEFIPSVVSNCS